MITPSIQKKLFILLDSVEPEQEVVRPDSVEPEQEAVHSDTDVESNAVSDEPENNPYFLQALIAGNDESILRNLRIGNAPLKQESEERKECLQPFCAHMYGDQKEADRYAALHDLVFEYELKMSSQMTENIAGLQSFFHVDLSVTQPQNETENTAKTLSRAAKTITQINSLFLPLTTRECMLALPVVEPIAASISIDPGAEKTLNERLRENLMNAEDLRRMPPIYWIVARLSLAETSTSEFTRNTSLNAAWCGFNKRNDEKVTEYFNILAVSVLCPWLSHTIGMAIFAYSYRLAARLYDRTDLDISIDKDMQTVESVIKAILFETIVDLFVVESEIGTRKEQLEKEQLKIATAYLHKLKREYRKNRDSVLPDLLRVLIDRCVTPAMQPKCVFSDRLGEKDSFYLPIRDNSVDKVLSEFGLLAIVRIARAIFQELGLSPEVAGASMTVTLTRYLLTSEQASKVKSISTTPTKQNIPPWTASVRMIHSAFAVAVGELVSCTDMKTEQNAKVDNMNHLRASLIDTIKDESTNKHITDEWKSFRELCTALEGQLAKLGLTTTAAKTDLNATPQTMPFLTQVFAEQEKQEEKEREEKEEELEEG